MNEATAISEINATLKEMSDKMKEYKRDKVFIHQLFTDSMRLINHIKIIGIRMGALDEYKFDGVYVDPKWIVRLVESSLGVDTSVRWRKREVINARQYIAYLIYKYSRITLKDITEYVGLNDHTSVLHHVNKVRGFLTYDEEVQNTINKFEDAIISKFYEGSSYSFQALQRSGQAILRANSKSVGGDKGGENKELDTANKK